jgi:REP element-mobilizing transposase RayT
MDFFKNKYRIASARAPFWDYSRNASYFVTICTKNREPWFGRIENGKMELSELGWTAFNCWTEIPQHFPFVELDAFVIMPDHVHGIIKIHKHELVETQDLASLQVAPLRAASLQVAPLRVMENLTMQPKNKFGPQSRNLASIVRGFKIGVSKKSRQINSDFSWQSRYHDRIIRNGLEHLKIARYIQNNPRNWKGHSGILE